MQKDMSPSGMESIDERIRKAIERTESIDYFKPLSTVEEANSIILEVDRNIYNHMLALKKWKKHDMTFYEAENTAFEEVLGVAWGLALSVELSMAFGRMRDVARDVVWYAMRYVLWKSVEGLERFKTNPFEPIIQLYELGSRPIGFRRVNGKERFVVDFPINGYWGCYAYGDGKILYIHDSVDCEKLRPLNPQTPPRTISRIL